MTIGKTRITGKAGPMMDLAMYLATDLSELAGPLKVEAPRWLYGTGAGAVNVIYADKVTLADGANTTLDLYASGAEGLLDIFMRALTMTALKFLYLKNNSADATLLAFGGAVLDIPIMGTTSDIEKIKPGGWYCWADPSAAGLLITTNKNLYLEHDGTGSLAMIVDVIAMGLD